MYCNINTRFLGICHDIAILCSHYNRSIIARTNPCKIRQNSCRNFASFNDFWKRPINKEKDFGTYSIVKPGEVTAGLLVPEHINCPPYSVSMQPSPPPKEAEIQTEEIIQSIRQACQLARYILDTVSKSLQIGITTNSIDEMVHNLTIENGAYPSPLNYMGFPKSVCTSVNNVACHGIPDDRPLEDGDIINIDVTVYLNGCHGDCSSTYLIGNVDKQGQQLVDATKKCLNEAISICKDGEYFCNIGHVIETVARREGFTVVAAFAGHGIGTYFHGPPDILHCHNSYPGRMRTGMVFTVEPVLSQGSREIVVLEDGWTAVTLDNARTAQFEHTLLITQRGADILTGPAW